MTWKELNENVFRALETERSIFFILMGTLIAVASLNVLGTLTMLLLEKRREVAILRALGLSWARMRKIFLFDGLLIGFAGVSLGILLGLGGLFILKTWQPIHLAPEVYFVKNVPVDFSAKNLVLVMSAAFVIVLVGCELALKRLTRFTGVRSLLENS
jgi:ABC-type lipoprotein release transport system permease subunit